MTLKARVKKRKYASDSEVKSAIGAQPSKPRYEVEAISNGWIVTKTWTDKEGMYKCEKVYHEENPFEKDPMKSED